MDSSSKSSSVSNLSLSNSKDDGSGNSRFNLFSFFFLIIYLSTEGHGPRKSTRADYETAIEATGIFIIFPNNFYYS